MVTDTIDWTGCPITERDPEKMGGVSTLRGERLSADNIIHNIDIGATPEEISEDFDVPIDDVRTLIAYAERVRHSAHPVR